jgi:hypothetical protein
MFLAGTCAILTALSISYAGNPNASNQQAIVTKNLLAKTEELYINCRGGIGVDPEIMYYCDKMDRVFRN